MAASILMASDHNVKNVQALSEDYHQTKPPAETRPPKQSGRRKPKANDQSTQKKKPPQRGMGVAQLERLRLQERWKKMTEMSNPLQASYNNTHHQTHYPFMPSSSSSSFADQFAKIGGAVVANGVAQVGLNNQGLYVQRVGNEGFNGQAARVVYDDQSCVDLYGVVGGWNANFLVGNDHEASQELSSMPNIKCPSDRCGVCYKKKRVKGENLGCNGVRDMQTELPSINGCGFMGYKVGDDHNIDGSSYSVGSSYRSVEVVAVHRKGSSRGGGVLMEYDFFPEKGGSSGSSSSRSSFSSANDLMMKLMSSETWSAAEANGEAAYNCVSADATGVESSSCVDLSLKLCYY